MNDRDSLAELRAWRDEFARSHGYDVHAMGEALREMDKSSRGKLIRGEPRRPGAENLADTIVEKKVVQANDVTMSDFPNAKPLGVTTVGEI